MTDPSCFIRPMATDDLLTVLEWRNHPDVRRFMYTRHEISLKEHQSWFKKCQSNELRQLLVLSLIHI